ncbi:hypothetical protein D3C84_890200 [compost metagenome]
MAIATVVTIGTTACLAPCASASLAVGPVKPDVPWRPSTSAGIDRQQRRLHGMQLQFKVAPGQRCPLISTRSATRSDLTALTQLCPRHFNAQCALGRGNGNACLLAQLQLVHFQFDQTGRQQQRCGIGHVQTLQVHDTGFIRQTQ